MLYNKTVLFYFYFSFIAVGGVLYPLNSVWFSINMRSRRQNMQLAETTVTIALMK